MTDDELLEYLGLPDGPDERMYIANLTTKHRAVYEQLRELEQDITLWQAGVGPKPTRAILCFEHAKESK